MPYILEDLSREAVTRAIEDNMMACFYSLAQASSRMTFHDDGDVKWYISDAPFPILNGVMFAKFDASSAGRRIDEIVAEFEAAGMPVLWWANPASDGEDIGPLLVERGLVQVGVTPGMAIDLSKMGATDSPLPGVAIKRVTSDEALAEYTGIVQQAFEIPDFAADVFSDALRNKGYSEDSDVQNYVAYLEEKPVASCTTAYGVGVAGIYNVGTLEAARGRGIGRAITLKALLDAREAGYRVGVLEASEVAYNIYRKLGFEDYCQVEQYVYMPQSE